MENSFSKSPSVAVGGHGHQDAWVDLGSSGTVAEVVVKSPCHDRQHDVVQRDALGSSDLPQVLQRERHPGEVTMRTNGTCDGQLRRRRRRQHHGLRQRSHPADQTSGATKGCDGSSASLDPALHLIGQGVQEEAAGGRRRFRDPGRWRLGSGHRFEIEDREGEFEYGHAVSHDVVDLEHHGDAVTLEAFDDPDLPERPAAVEGHLEQHRHEGAQLGKTTGTRQCRRPHVVGDVERLVVDPDRPPLVERDRKQLLAETGDAAEAALDVAAEFVHPEQASLVEQRTGFE